MEHPTSSSAWAVAGHAAKVYLTSRVSRGWTDTGTGRSKDGLYEPALADSEREAVADLLQYLENVRRSSDWPT